MTPYVIATAGILGFIGGMLALAIAAERLFVAADRFFTNNNEKK